MAWTTPQTVVADSTELTAALWNEQVRDNTNFLYTPPMCALGLTASQSIPHNAFTALSFTAADEIDTDDMHSTSVNPSRITINTAGVYMVSGLLNWGASANGTDRVASVFKNGSEVGGFRPGALSLPSYSVSTSIILGASHPMNLAVGDYIELRGYQTSGGGALNAISGSKFSAVWIGSAP